MAFRRLRVVLSVVLLVAAFAATSLADWEFSTPAELDMDPASRRTYERERDVSTLLLNPDINFKLPEAISNAS